MPSFGHPFPLFSLHQLLSFSRVGGAIVCLWLVYEEHWFTQWGLACAHREGGEIWMNLQHPNPPLPPSIPKFSHHLSSSLHTPQAPPVTLFHWCVRVSVRVYLCKARGAANTGQRLIFVARPVCIPTACRRLGGQLLLPAPFPHPRASPERLCNQPLLSHFKILQDKNQCLVSCIY